MKKRKKVLVGAVIFFTCGLHTVYGKYLYQESRTDVIHTTESESNSKADTAQEPDENMFFSDGSTWESEELFSDFVCEADENLTVMK